MKITFINPPHTAIGSVIPNEHLPPLGLLAVAGPLIDYGCDVRLIDADLHALSQQAIIDQTLVTCPDIVMIGHSGSSSVHATVVSLCQRLKRHLPHLTIVYGGVHPSYHWDEILRLHHDIDFIVRGEGEQTTLNLIKALQHKQPLIDVNGIAFRQDGEVIGTAPAEFIQCLDDYRIAWELIDCADYSYWGGKRAVVVQFSRGCPYPCNYCGQRGFWTKWRHRDPVAFAKELAWLYREKGVELINFADELPTGSKKAWKAFLLALIAEDVPLLLVGSTRAGDIVRDKDHLHLYKQAGVIRFLLGIESYNDTTLKHIDKRATRSEDQTAIALLRQHGIVSMATYVVGFDEERDRDFWQTYRHLVNYDPDQIQLLYATPHRWTPFYNTVKSRKVLLTDTNQWDYKHQVLDNPHVPAWRIFLWFKLIEVFVQARPKVIARTLFHRDADYRHAMRWYTRIGRRVWFHEVFAFIFRRQHLKHPPTLAEFLGDSLAEREYVLSKPISNPTTTRRRQVAKQHTEPQHPRQTVTVAQGNTQTDKTMKYLQ